MSNCVTHSHACDCREERFKKIEEQLREAREVISFYAHKRNWYQNMGSVIREGASHPNLSQDLDADFIGGRRAREFMSKWKEGV